MAEKKPQTLEDKLNALIYGNKISDDHIEDVAEYVKALQDNAEIWSARMEALINIDFHDAALPDLAELGGTFAKLEEAAQTIDWAKEDAGNMKERLDAFYEQADEFEGAKDTALDEDTDDDDRDDARDTLGSLAGDIRHIRDELLKSYKLDLEADA